MQTSKFVTNLVSYLEKNIGSLSVDDVTNYNWINDDLKKELAELDTTQPIQVSFYISGIENRDHRIFIGSEDDDHNITVTKSNFSKILEIFLREVENVEYKYNIIGDDAEYEFVGLQSLKKFVM